MKSNLKKEEEASQKIALDVPIIYQPDDSLECSVAAMQMIMHYWGDIVDYKALVRDLSEWVNEKERHLQGIGIYLARRGYEVRLHHHDASVIDENIENLTETGISRLVKRLSAIPDKDETQFRRRKIALDIKFIESGGKYSNKIPTLALIDSSLENKIPVMVCIKLQIWKSNPNIRNNHYVIVVGRDGDEYIINDPSSKMTSPYRASKWGIEMGSATIYDTVLSCLEQEERT